MRVAVIGGGIQGITVALELSRRGIGVELLESRHSLMEGASRHNEGKIHLGFVYANDSSLRTARLQVRGAGSFCELMRAWLGPAFDSVPTSTFFNYVVHEQSLLSPQELHIAYKGISALIHRECADGAYFGLEDPGQIDRFGPEELVGSSGTPARAVFSTREIAVEPDSLADLIVNKVTDTDNVDIRLGAHVTRVDRGSREVIVSVPDGNPRSIGMFDHVINCAWDGRPEIDASVGLLPPAPWSHRMKYFLKANTSFELPSSTIVLGPFGDIVQFRNGDQYLSWYPSGLRGWTSGLRSPRWPVRPSNEDALETATEILRHLAVVVPDVARLSPAEVEVRGGPIYALGNTDVDDPRSRLHQRWEVGPITVEGWYHSVDTGKYTTAPLFAVDVADRITEKT